VSRRSRKTAPALKELLANLAHADPETRWQAARELGSVGDRSAVLPLEHMALTDDESFQAEGAFVDSTEAPSQAALDALCEIYARHPPSPEDIARVRAHLSEQGLSDRSERLVLSLRAGAL
jgi:HEAT repeat protein